MSERHDVAVVGGGILGLAVAREWLVRRPENRVAVLEQASRVGAHQSTHNSGVIHAGVYYAPGSLKAELCVSGARQMYDFCQRHGIEARKVGKLIIATHAAELTGLEEIERRARANGVAGIRRLGAEEIRELEPHATGIAAVHSPNTGIVDFAAVCGALAAEIRGAGGEVRLGWRVEHVREDRRSVSVIATSGQALEASVVIGCAGLWSDRLATTVGAPPDPRILPFRGAYLRLTPRRRELVRGLIYPVPDPALPFLGVHLTRRIDGEVILGPSALLVGARDAYRLSRVRRRDVLDTLAWPGTWRMAARWWRTGVRELHLAIGHRAFATAAARYLPELTAQDLLPGFAGVRAQAVGRDGRLIDDFVLSSTARTVHVRNAPSPAATSSLALAARIVDTVEHRLR